MVDDGNGPDRVAEDGIFSLSFSARSSLSEGEISLMIRATDIFLSTTSDTDQLHNVSIIKSSSGESGSSWVSEHSNELIFSSVVILLAIGIGAFAHIVRNAEFE